MRFISNTGDVRADLIVDLEKKYPANLQVYNVNYEYDGDVHSGGSRGTKESLEKFKKQLLHEYDFTDI